MVEAARAWLASLSDVQRKRASRTLSAQSRVRWNFFPGARSGLALKRMNDAQRAAAFALVRRGLSNKGYETLRGILTVEGVLQAALSPTRRRMSPEWRDPGLYHLAVFGTPHAQRPWGWRLEGHHLSLNFTFVPGRGWVGTPFFLGANPAYVMRGPHKGLRVLGAQEDTARRLLASLRPDQRTRAVLARPASGDLFHASLDTLRRIQPAGLPASAMDASQQALLWSVIESYARNFRAEVVAHEIAEARKAGIGKVHFAWRGDTRPGGNCFYRIQGPTLVIEFSNDGNHIHSIWRDPVDEFAVASLRSARRTSR